MRLVRLLREIVDHLNCVQQLMEVRIKCVDDSQDDEPRKNGSGDIENFEKVHGWTSFLK